MPSAAVAWVPTVSTFPQRGVPDAAVHTPPVAPQVHTPPEHTPFWVEEAVQSESEAHCLIQNQKLTLRKWDIF